MISLSDLDAMLDVLGELLEQVDDMDAKQAILFRDKADDVRRKADEVKAFMNSRALTTLDGQPIRVGDNVYMPKPTGKWRTDHEKIKNLVAVRAFNKPDGSGFENPRTAASKAVNMMYALFVSPSSVPKQGTLDQLGVDLKDFATYERTGKELKVVVVGEEDK